MHFMNNYLDISIDVISAIIDITTIVVCWVMHIICITFYISIIPWVLHISFYRHGIHSYTPSNIQNVFLF